MCSAAASSELGPAPGWRVRGGGAGATPLYTDNLQRVSNSQHGTRRTGGGRCGRLKPRTGTNTGTSTGAPPQARLSLNEQRGRTVRTGTCAPPPPPIRCFTCALPPITRSRSLDYLWKEPSVGLTRGQRVGPASWAPRSPPPQSFSDRHSALAQVIGGVVNCPAVDTPLCMRQKDCR